MSANNIPTEDKMDTTPAPDTGKNVSSNLSRKRPGKQSKFKSRDTFRKKIGDKMQKELTNSLFAKYAMPPRVEDSLQHVEVKSDSYAVKANVTSRGVGVSTAVSYDRAVTSWSMRQIWEICTVHQAYRAHLAMYEYGLFMSSTQQTDRAVGPPSDYPMMNEEMRQFISSRRDVFTGCAAIYTSLGRVCLPDGRIFHSVRPPIPPAAVHVNRAVWRAFFGTLSDLRASVVYAANPNSPVAARDILRNYCSWPGALWDDGVLDNPDDLMPVDYGIDQLREDFNAFGALVQRVSGRLKNLFSSVQWSGVGTTASLISTPIGVPADGTAIHLVSDFDDHDHYIRTQTLGSVLTDHWTTDPSATNTDWLMGAISMLGETPPQFPCAIRDENAGTSRCTLDPLTTLINVINVPFEQR